MTLVNGQGVLDTVSGLVYVCINNNGCHGQKGRFLPHSLTTCGGRTSIYPYSPARILHPITHHGHTDILRTDTEDRTSQEEFLSRLPEKSGDARTRIENQEWCGRGRRLEA